MLRKDKMVAGRNERRLSVSSAQPTCRITLCSTVQALSPTNRQRDRSTPNLITTMTKTSPFRTETKIKGKLVYACYSICIVFHIVTSDKTITYSRDFVSLNALSKLSNDLCRRD